jgi:hypothetical protein
MMSDVNFQQLFVSTTNKETFFTASNKNDSMLLDGDCEHASISFPVSETSIARVDNQIYIALCEEKQAVKLMQGKVMEKYVIVKPTFVDEDSLDFGLQAKGFWPSSLVDIYRFNSMADRIARQNADSKLVFSSGILKEVQIQVVFLVGCHIMLSKGFNPDETLCLFNNIDGFVVDGGEGQLAIIDCWRALHRVAAMRWIKFVNTDDECDEDHTIDMDAFTHYSR